MTAAPATPAVAAATAGATERLVRRLSKQGLQRQLHYARIPCLERDVWRELPLDRGVHCCTYPEPRSRSTEKTLIAVIKSTEAMIARAAEANPPRTRRSRRRN